MNIYGCFEKVFQRVDDHFLFKTKFQCIKIYFFFYELTYLSLSLIKKVHQKKIQKLQYSKNQQLIKTMFKTTQDQGQDFKKKRQQFTQNIRKTNRQQKFSKRRNILPSDNLPLTPEINNIKKEKLLIVDNRYAPEIQKFLQSTYTMQNFNELLQSITSEDILRQHYGLIGIRKILSIAENPPIQSIIDAGLVPKMIDYIKQNEYPQLQLQATWALTNVASGTTAQCQSIIDKGGIPLFVELLRNQSLGIVEQAIWAIGNIASDCTFHRDSIIRNGGVANLIYVIQNNLKESNIVKHGAWALSNLCRGNPLPKYQNIKDAIPLLCHLIANNLINDKQIIADCCWGISYHSDCRKKNKIPVLVESGIIPRLVSYINDDYLSLIVPVIRTLGNVSSGTTVETDQIIKYGAVEQLYYALNHPKKVVRREACWVYSNITAGSKNQVELIKNNQMIISKLLQLFKTDANDVRRQICYIFSNMSHCGQPLQLYNFYKANSIIECYINLLSVDDFKTVEVAIECLYQILSVGEKIKGSDKNPLVMQIFNLNAVDKLQKLQYHDSEIVYENVSNLLQKYFQIQDPLQF